MIDFASFIYNNFAWLMPLPFLCLLYLAAILDCNFWVVPFWIYSSRFLSTWSFIRSHSIALSLTPSLPPTPSVFKNFNSSTTAFSFASSLANHLFSAWGCLVIPSFSSFWTSCLCFFLYLRHFAYQCLTDYTISLHHQQSGALITSILARCVPTAPCPTLS